MFLLVLLCQASSHQPLVVVMNGFGLNPKRMGPDRFDFSYKPPPTSVSGRTIEGKGDGHSLLLPSVFVPAGARSPHYYRESKTNRRELCPGTFSFRLVDPLSEKQGMALPDGTLEGLVAAFNC